MGKAHTFAGNPLDRADAQRRDAAWLESAVNDPTSRFLPFSELNALIDSSAETRLAWLGRDEVAQLRTSQPPVLLGLLDGIAHFAIDLTDVEDVADELSSDKCLRFEDARAVAMRLAGTETGILAQGRAQVEWHQSHRHCSVCGAPTEPGRGGDVRVCRGCGAEHFPRTNPVVIMLISDGDRCLLGQSRGRLAGLGLYSALAGFVGQGESIEEAVRREVREEAGVTVGEVRYHSSQPWPFPSSLMIGCHGRALTTQITIDPQEMADASWFGRDEVRAALQQEHPTLRVPGPIAIAHHLIKTWCDGSVEI